MPELPKPFLKREEFCGLVRQLVFVLLVAQLNQDQIQLDVRSTADHQRYAARMGSEFVGLRRHGAVNPRS